MDASVLLENNQWRIFHILASDDIDDVIYHFLHWIYIIKRKLHSGLKIWGWLQKHSLAIVCRNQWLNWFP